MRQPFHGQPSSRVRAHSARRSAREVFGHAAEAIGPVDADANLFLVTRGQFGFLDIIRHCLDELGPSALSVWTWAIAEHDVETLGVLMSDKRVRSALLVVDRSTEQRSTEIVERWRALFGEGSVRVCKNHAKIARVWNPYRRVLIRGSLNLNQNPRFEQVDLTVDGEDFDLVAELEAELPVLPRWCSNLEAEAASKVSRAWELGELEAFRGVRTWKP